MGSKSLDSLERTIFLLLLPLILIPLLPLPQLLLLPPLMPLPLLPLSAALSLLRTAATFCRIRAAIEEAEAEP